MSDVPGSIKTVRDIIQELADFEKMGNSPKLTEKDLIRDAGLNGGHEHCHIYVLDLQTQANEAPERYLKMTKANKLSTNEKGHAFQIASLGYKPG